MSSRVWSGEQTLPEFWRNLSQMLSENANRFATRPIFGAVVDDQWVYLSWQDFHDNLLSIQTNLTRLGFLPGDKLAILSTNRQEMLELEMAVMGMGGVTVPIFSGYPADKADELLEFCDATFVAVANDKQFSKISDPTRLKHIISFDNLEQPSENVIPFDKMSGDKSATELLGAEVERDTVCLMMYTSGTMGKPKCVQLTHGNILSQQAAMRVLWQLKETDRFLSYLPWHHSFGGIYEKYAAITNGALLALEHGYGKNIQLLIENWKAIRPTVFFSVPRIYQEIVTQVSQSPEIEELIFHDELRFVFTAAAPLPRNIADMFESRSIPVYEGWGLTETSPCCTVTDPDVPRASGVVGKPIAGVSLQLSDENEIMVKGPNVMTGYYNNPEATAEVLPGDGWFATGDVGEFTETGLRLIARKDRIFKLSNAEKVVPTEIENLIVRDCPYLAHAYVSGSGRDHPVILLFPNQKMFSKVAGRTASRTDCACPDGMVDFAKCLGKCLDKMNDSLEARYACVRGAMLIDYELSIENEELTPSMKLAPNILAKVFKANIEQLHGDDQSEADDVYLIDLES